MVSWTSVFNKNDPYYMTFLIKCCHHFICIKIIKKQPNYCICCFMERCGMQCTSGTPPRHGASPPTPTLVYSEQPSKIICFLQLLLRELHTNIRTCTGKKTCSFFTSKYTTSVVLRYTVTSPLYWNWAQCSISPHVPPYEELKHTLLHYPENKSILYSDDKRQDSLPLKFPR